MDWNVVRKDRKRLTELLDMLLSFKDGIEAMVAYNTIEGEGKILGILVLNEKLQIADLSELEESINIEIDLIENTLQRLDKEEGLYG